MKHFDYRYNITYAPYDFIFWNGWFSFMQDKGIYLLPRGNSLLGLSVNKSTHMYGIVFGN